MKTLLYCECCWLAEPPWTLSFSVSLPQHPLPYVGRTEHCAAFCLTAAEEAHHLHVHQRHLVEVQHNPGSAALHLCLQLREMLRLQVAKIGRASCREGSGM